MVAERSSLDFHPSAESIQRASTEPLSPEFGKYLLRSIICTQWMCLCTFNYSNHYILKIYLQPEGGKRIPALFRLHSTLRSFFIFFSNPQTRNVICMNLSTKKYHRKTFVPFTQKENFLFFFVCALHHEEGIVKRNNKTVKQLKLYNSCTDTGKNIMRNFSCHTNFTFFLWIFCCFIGLWAIFFTRHWNFCVLSKKNVGNNHGRCLSLLQWFRVRDDKREGWNVFRLIYQKIVETPVKVSLFVRRDSQTDRSWKWCKRNN